MGGAHQREMLLDGACGKGAAELNYGTRNEHKEIRDGRAGEGQGLCEEDESRINGAALDVEESHVLEAAAVAHNPVLEKQQHKFLAPVVQWERFLPLRTLKVLLVENDDSTRQVVSALLRNCYYEVTAVANVLEAWRVLEDLTNRIDLVLTEVVMPSFSGLGLLCKIMSHKTCKTIPVIMMSSNDSMGIVFKCLSKGAVDFLVKPIRKNELKNLWQHVWRRCHTIYPNICGRQRYLRSMEATNTAFDHMKLSGVDQQRLRKYSALPWKLSNAFTCNSRRWSYPCLESRRFDGASNIAPLTCHATSDRIWNAVMSYKQVPAIKMRSTTEVNFSMEACTFSENINNISTNTSEEKIGVLLLNLGGPETLEDVKPFLFNLFADPDIIRLPRLFRFLQKPLAFLISSFRAPKSKEAYASIGGGSPLRKITDEQADAIKTALEDRGLSANVYVAMRYWHPFTEEAISQIKRDGITKLVILPLYPQFSISTSGSSIRVLQSIFREDSYFTRVAISIIESWYQREGYIRSMADLIEKEISKFSKPEEVMIFFSAHGVPLSYVENSGDPYRDQMEECISLIMDELKSRKIMNNHTLAYQSRVGPVQWLKPYTDEVIVELGQKGVNSLLAVPVSFVSEHIETLEEIDMEYKHLALESGITNWGRVPALGCTSSFISDLADAVIDAIPSASAIPNATNEPDHADKYTLQYMMNLFFGSILAFFFLLSPRLISMFRNNPLLQ